MEYKVSVVLCTYNGERYIREQLESVLTQTYPLYEIIISDDCSSDHTWEIVKEYEDRYPDLIRCYQNETNLYWWRNFYKAMLLAKGDYIAFCDQDDVWNPDKIGKQIEAIGDNYVCVHGDYCWVGDEQNPRYAKKMTTLEALFFSAYSLHDMLVSREFVCSYVRLGQSLDFPCDSFFSMVGLCYGRLAIVDDLLVEWRRHEKTTTGELIVDRVISGRAKILSCMHSFLFRNKSKRIEVGIERYYRLFNWMEIREKVNRKYRDMLRLTKHLKRQTILDYVCAGLMLVKMRKELGYYKLSIKSFCYLISFPFRWWYDLKDDF